MTSPAARFVVFDLGNVLIRWDPVAALEPTMGREAAVAFLQDPRVDFAGRNLRADAGEPWQVLADELAELNPAWGEAARTYVANFDRAIAEPISGSVAVLDELIAAGIPVYALTNWSAQTFAVAKAKFDFLQRFRHIVVSGEVGAVKPQPAIWAALEEHTKTIGPFSCGVFIDDAPVNVAGALQAGLDAIHFTSPQQLRAELRLRGLPVG